MRRHTVSQTLQQTKRYCSSAALVGRECFTDALVGAILPRWWREWDDTAAVVSTLMEAILFGRLQIDERLLHFFIIVFLDLCESLSPRAHHAPVQVPHHLLPTLQIHQASVHNYLVQYTVW